MSEQRPVGPGGAPRAEAAPAHTGTPATEVRAPLPRAGSQILVRLIDPIGEQARLILPKIYVACRTCYSERSPHDLWTEAATRRVPEKKMVSLVERVIESGHTSTLEHVNFTFLIEGVSRTLTHQLVRHRVGTAFEQQSQRYVKYKHPVFVTPNSVQRLDPAREIAEAAIDDSRRAYDALVALGVPAEDARFYFLNAITSSLVFSVNLRQLIHMMGLRLCTMAQWEIRRLHVLMRKEVVAVAPWLARHLQPKCVPLGYCDEMGNKDEHCKVRPYRDNVLKVYDLWRKGGLVPANEEVAGQLPVLAPPAAVRSTQPERAAPTGSTAVASRTAGPAAV